MPLARSAANNAVLPVAGVGVAGVVVVVMLPFCPWVPDGRRGLWLEMGVVGVGKDKATGKAKGHLTGADRGASGGDVVHDV